MRKVIKTLLFVIVVLMGFFMASISKASETTYVYNGTYGYTTESEEEFEIVDGVKHIINRGTGISDSGKTLKPGRLNHIFVADIKNNDSLKVVTWAVKREDNTGFTRCALLDIAKDYEEKHPGWVILAGVNADQFYTGFGTGLGSNGTDYYAPQPYYPYISDGDNLFAISPYANCNNVAGFKNNGDDVQIVYGTSDRSIKGLYVYVYDENKNILGTFPAKNLNVLDQLGENETTIIAPYASETRSLVTLSKSSTNSFYVVENPELSYVSNSEAWTWKANEGYNVNAFFGKGNISKIENSISLNTNSFAIETTNAELKALLKVGAYVRCQYEFDDGFAGIKEATGFHTCHILNGEVQEVANGYNTPNYPRSMFGCDNNGKVYFIATEKSTEPKDGMRGQEMNALMLQYGITNAFQCDGGGSVQSICRNEDGVLDYSQSPYEGGYRPVLTGHFIAMKVENISLDITDFDNNHASIKVVDENKEYGQLAIKVRHEENGEEKLQIIDIDNEIIKLDDLIKNTKYSVQVCIKQADGTYKELYIKRGFTTLKDFPLINSVSIKLQEDKSYKIEIDLLDVDDVVQKASIYVNGKKKSINVRDSKITLDFEKGTEGIFNISFEFDCTFNGETRTVKIEEYKLNATCDIYLEHIKSSIESFFDFE